MKPPRLHQAPSLLPRIFTVLAAILLVCALAAATLTPPETTLADGLQTIWPSFPSALQIGARGISGGIFWKDIAEPLLARPVWLLPASLGFIFVGAAVSSAISPPRHSRRKRS